MVYGGKKLSYEIPVKRLIKYNKFFLVLVRERKEVPNNIIAYDYSGNELWKVNDIVKAKIPRGYSEMEKISESMLRAYYELGIIYEIDLNTMSVVQETYTR